MIIFLSLFVLICLLIALIIVILFPGKKKRKKIFISEGINLEGLWSMVEKGPDSTFTERIDQDK